MGCFSIVDSHTSSGYVHAVPDSYSADTIPYRIKLPFTRKILRDFCNGAKLRRAVLDSGESHFE